MTLYHFPTLLPPLGLCLSSSSWVLRIREGTVIPPHPPPRETRLAGEAGQPAKALSTDQLSPRTLLGRVCTSPSGSNLARDPSGLNRLTTPDMAPLITFRFSLPWGEMWGSPWPAFSKNPLRFARIPYPWHFLLETFRPLSPPCILTVSSHLAVLCRGLNPISPLY